MKEPDNFPGMPLISVITATYNAAAFLENSIKSVINQSYKNIELIIIDGGSTDQTIEIIKKYQDRIKYWISEKDRGVYDAWNKGLARSNGDWICFLGADDVFIDEGTIANAVPFLNSAGTQNIRYVYGKVKLLSIAGDKLITTWGEPWSEAKKNIFKYMTITHCGAFHHKDLFKEHGNFDTNFRITGDYELTLREFSSGKDALFIDQPLTAMRAGGISADLKLKIVVARENIKALRKNNQPILFHHYVQIAKARISNVLIRVIGIGNVKRGSDVYRRLTGKDPLWTKIE